MTYKQPLGPPQPVGTTQAELTHALDRLLKAAVAVGANEPGAVEKAKRARAKYDAALAERLRSEHAQAREWAINGLNASLGGSLHSAAARGNHDVDWRAAIEEALAHLKASTW